MRWCVITRNFVLDVFAISSTRLQKRSTLVSSSGASTSSRTQIGAGFDKKTANKRDNAVKALTALSLLFAVFLSNPAPICVLDEVDAPLDDTNVDRFCSLVEEIAKTSSTKFLVITHHRMTMARVNRLFGVTMPEQGVSQLVSVDLERAIEIRDKDSE